MAEPAPVAIMHPTLTRQLRRLGLSAEQPPADSAQWQELLTRMSRFYEEADQENYLLQRSLELSSAEMQAMNGALLDKQRELEATMLRLMEGEAQARAVLDNVADGIITIDGEDLIRSWNRAAERIFGYAAEEAIGQNINLMMPSDHRHRRTSGVRRDGSRFPLELLLTSVQESSGPLFIALVRDVTAEKEAAARQADTHAQLLAVSRQAGMAEVATSVLHNIGNILNSVNVAMTMLSETLRTSRLSGLCKAAELLSQHAADLVPFLSADERGRRLPDYLVRIAACLVEEQSVMRREIDSVTGGLQHVMTVVATQQAYARVGGVAETVPLPEVIEEALQFHRAAFERSQIEVRRRYADLPPMSVERNKLLQILINLLGNASHALLAREVDRWIIIGIGNGIGSPDAPRVRIEIRDNGIGIPQDNLTKIFAFGFTTKKDGHGFGLHQSALAAREMGGSLSCHSDGPGQGAVFTLELPFQPRGG